MFRSRSYPGTLRGFLAGSLAAAMVMGAASGAAAAPTDRSEALGKFLGGETLTIDLDSIAEIRGALEQNPSGVPPVGPTANPLSAEVLSSLGVDVGSSLQLFGPGGLIELGAVSQYAQAADNGDALAASGAVNDQGAISVGAPGTPPANAALTLTPLLATLPAANGVVSQLDIDLGALASSASQVQGGPVVRDYAIADATLDLTSPLVAATVSGTVATLQTTVNRVESLLETALGARLNVLNVATAAATVDVEEPDLQSLLPTEFTSTRTPGVVLDLRSGQVSVDVEAVLAANGVDLNDLPPNTPLLSGVFGQYIGQAILVTLSEAVDQVQADLIRTVRSLEVTGTVAVTVDLPLLPDVVVNVALGGTLDDITVSASGVTGAVLLLLDVNALANLAVDGVLSGTVEPALALVTSTLDAVAVGLPTVVVSPILGIVESVVRIRANVQPEIGDLGTGTATVRAAEVTLLPLTPIATVDLASSTVRGTAFVAPIYDPTITLEPSTVSAGTSTTVTGSGFAPNEQVTVSVPSINGQAGSSVSTTATADGTIDVDLPIPASYPVGLINVVALGAESDVPATAGLTVTAVVYAPSIALDPATVVAGGSTVVTGEGFANGETVTVSIPGINGGNPITVEVIAGDDGTFEATLPVPAGYPTGPVDVTVVGDVSDTPVVEGLVIEAPAVVYDPSITLDPAIVVAGGSTVVSGAGFANGETVTVSIPGAVEGDDPITVEVIAGDDGSFEATLPVPAGYPTGPVDVTVVGDISDTPVVEELTVEAPAVVYDPSITLDPATVVVGGSTVVTGEGFANGETVTVSIPGAVEGDDPITVEVLAGDDGTFEVALPIPAGYPTGPVDVTVVGDISDTPVVEELVVEAPAVGYDPSITLDPATVVGGGSTVVTGEGFANGETVTVSIPGATEDDDPITVEVIAGDDGTFEATLPVPAGYPAGPVEVSASGPVSDTVATAGLTVEAPAVVYDPSIALDPATVVAGGSTVVTGEGFANGETVTVSIPGAIEGDDPITVEVLAGDDGTFEATLPVPAGYPVGAVEVSASGPVSDTVATADLTVQAPAVVYDPSIALDPATVVAGGSTVVTGEGFANGETVTVSIPGINGGNPITVEVLAGDDGSFEVALPIPAGYPVGAVEVSASGPVSDTVATADLTVQAPAVVYDPSIALDPATVVAGGSTVVTGEGFANGETVTVSIPGAGEGDDPITVEVLAGNDGSFEVALPVPAGYPTGAVDVTVLGDISDTPVVEELVVEAPAVGYDPSITLDPATVVAGRSTVVTGEGFANGETVTVSIPGATEDDDPITVEVIAGDDGSFEVALPIPAGYPVGAVEVSASGPVSETVVTADLTVQAPAVVYDPSIVLDPATVVAGGSTVVTGAGFANGETVTVAIPGAGEGDDPITVEVLAGNDGTFEVALPIPAGYPAGPVEVSASGPVSDTVATADLTVEAPAVVYDPSITLDPATVVAGGSTVVTGEGFANGETVTVSIPGAAEGDDPITVEVIAGDDGTFEATLPVPAGYPTGPVDVTVVGDISDTPVVEELTVEAPAVVYDPSITLDPATVVAGGSTVVTGAGFANGETVTVSIPGAAEGYDPITVEVIAGDDGTFEATLPVPAGYPVGAVEVSASGPVSDTVATADLTVQAPAVVYDPSITLDPATVVAGGSTVVTGEGFANGETVTVSIPGINGGNPITVEVIAGDDGSFEVALPVPAGYPAGPVDVTVVGDVSDTPVVEGLTVEAPAVVYDPSIVLDPATVVAGGSTVVTGAGFANGETVTVSIPGINGGNPITVEVIAGDDGTFEVALPIPAGYPAGPVDVTVVGDVSDTPVVEELVVQAPAVVYDPSITLDPATVVAGGSTVVTGEGFANGETVTVSIPGINGGNPITVEVLAGEDGSFEVTLPIPAGYPVGAVDVSAVGPVSGVPVTAGLIVQAPTVPIPDGPTIVVQPDAVTPGGTVVVVGEGFAPGEQVDVSLGCGGTATVVATGEGTFAVEVTVPADCPVGTTIVTAEGEQSDTPATALLTIRPATIGGNGDGDGNGDGNVIEGDSGIGSGNGTGNGNLADTGAGGLFGLVGIALTILLTGGAALATSSRRRR
jgi:hypothetical protein